MKTSFLPRMFNAVVSVDMCNYVLTLAFENFEHKEILLDYNWGKKQQTHLYIYNLFVLIYIYVCVCVCVCIYIYRNKQVSVALICLVLYLKNIFVLKMCIIVLSCLIK